MAWMLTSWFGPGSSTVLIWLMIAMALVFAALLVVGTVRPGSYWGPHRPASGYHLFAALAMAYATAVMPASHHTAGLSGTGGGHSGHQGHDMAGMAGAWEPSAPAWILAAVFALDAIATAAVVVFAPNAALAGVAAQPAVPSGGGQSLEEAPEPEGKGRLRASAVPHVVMDVAMVGMLLGGF
jgi:hypothetical protein